MNKMIDSPRVLVLCTVSTGLDSVAEVLRNGFAIRAIVGVDPKVADPKVISGFTDIAQFAAKWNIPHYYMQRYDLKSEGDRERLTALEFDLVWVAGWQRLVPDWLIAQASMGALGGHGSPDGIHGGRGRSPQNWAIMLGCKRFDLALFRLTPGVDDGPVIAQRSFFYNETDDIAISYKKVALCMGEMMTDVLSAPSLLKKAVPQSGEVFYYPQRKPEDGYVDWNLTQREIWAHCRALTRPYPGLRTRYGDTDIVFWDCVPFDDEVRNSPGIIDFVFEDGGFLVNCRDGRVLVKDFAPLGDWEPSPRMALSSPRLAETLKVLTARHSNQYPNASVARRIMNRIDDES